VAGINHFLNPQFYLPLIPEYIPWHEFINIFSGIAEILLAIGILFKNTRKISSLLIMLMLIAFIPSHWYFIQIGSCIDGGLCVDPIIGWLRLLLIHPILILWAYSVYKLPINKKAPH
jgi:uncharacterized membrane protein